MKRSQVAYLSPAELAERRRHDRWAAKGRARVALPGRKAVVVPCASPFAAIQCAAELWASHGRKSSTGRASCGRRRRHKKTPPAKIVKPAGGENPIAHRARYTIYYSIQLPALQAEKR